MEATATHTTKGSTMNNVQNFGDTLAAARLARAGETLGVARLVALAQATPEAVKALAEAIEENQASCKAIEAREVAEENARHLANHDRINEHTNRKNVLAAASLSWSIARVKDDEEFDAIEARYEARCGR